MMENCLDSIVLLNDAEHHPIERLSRNQKFHSHVLMQREALF